jgi:hypothetical protein
MHSRAPTQERRDVRDGRSTEAAGAANGEDHWRRARAGDLPLGRNHGAPSVQFIPLLGADLPLFHLQSRYPVELPDIGSDHDQPVRHT